MSSRGRHPPLLLLLRSLRLRRRLGTQGTDDWELTGIMALSAAARSLLAALALAAGRLQPEQALPLLRLEEAHQVKEWGYVEGGHDIDEADLRVRLAAPCVFLALLRRGGGQSGKRLMS